MRRIYTEICVSHCKKKIRDTFSRAGFGEVKLSPEKNNKKDKNMFRNGGRKY